MTVGTGDATEEFPAGKDADATGRGGFSGQFVVFCFDALAAEPCVDGSQQALCDRSFGERRDLGFVEADWERCVSGSNLRMVSISSPKNSMRMGRSDSGE